MDSVLERGKGCIDHLGDGRGETIEYDFVAWKGRHEIRATPCANVARCMEGIHDEVEVRGLLCENGSLFLRLRHEM